MQSIETRAELEAKVKEFGILDPGARWETGANHLYHNDIERNDPALVATVEELGELAGGWAADLQIVDIPDDANWEINEYDGMESVHEKHRRW
jgi:hypothetical protein